MRVTTNADTSPIVRNMRNDTDTQHPPRRTWYAKEWIAHKGLKQSDIVARTQFNKGQISEYVNGKRRWNQDVLEAFAVAIGVDWDVLLRHPSNTNNELLEYWSRMTEKQKKQAIIIIKAISSESDK